MSGDYAFVSVVRGTEPTQLVEPLLPQAPDPALYKPAPGLAEAMDTAMLLGMPLLLTGEPGTGKTQAARWLAYRLKARFLRHDVKSTTTGRELLYSFDEVARFRAANRGETGRLIDYVRFSALGEAIVRTWGGARPLPALREGAAIEPNAFPGEAAPVTRDLLPRDTGFASAGPEHCVVLIDEIDKAPRDTPNDLLAEFEALAFDIPELGVRMQADGRWRPIVILTSNSERALPEAFLRRCLFFNIPPPDEDAMSEIVGGLIREMPETPLFRTAFAYYDTLRHQPAIRKKPGTAEFLAWCRCLTRQAGCTLETTLPPEDAAQKARVVLSLVCLAKAGEDQTLAEKLFDAGGWEPAPRSSPPPAPR